MKKKCKTRTILSLILSLALVLGMCTTSYATEEMPEDGTEEEAVVETTAEDTLTEEPEETGDTTEDIAEETEDNLSDDVSAEEEYGVEALSAEVAEDGEEEEDPEIQVFASTEEEQTLKVVQKAEGTIGDDVSFTYHLYKITEAAETITKMGDITGSEPGADLDYVIVETDTGEEISTETTDEYGTFKIHVGETAEFTLEAETDWFVNQETPSDYPLNSVDSDGEYADVVDNNGVVYYGNIEPQDDPGLTSEVDYSQEENWAYYASAEGETKADVFFVCPTVYSGAGNMDIQVAKAGRSFKGAINMEKGIYDEETRFFAPYYSQVGLKVYEMDEEEMEPYLEIAYADVKNAFLYYLEEENDGNPIILAGFSQGGDMCIRLLKDCFADEEMQDQLVACYAIGWRITEEEMEEYPHLSFAEAADDTGVLITFDAEDPGIEDSIIIPKGTKSLCINPLTWSTDGAKADKSLNLGACFTNYDGGIETEISEFTGAYIDEERGALKVTDVSLEDYPPGLSIFEDGSYHTYDYEFFYRNLQENVQKRIDAYLD